MEMNGADVLVHCLAEHGVEHVFGYPGGAVLYIYDAIFKQDKFQHILVRHEQAAVHAADAYSRSSQKIGVCIVTSGPGATNAITGIATAYMDSIPMIIISGQVSSEVIGEDAFQECDTIGITRPCVKHNFLVRDVKNLADTIRRAFYIATTGRPGPVLIDIPKNITAARCKYSPSKEAVLMRSYAPVIKGHQGQVRKAAQILLSAERPIVYIGGGVVLSNASSELRDLLLKLGAPCVNTLMGLGAVAFDDPQCLGMPGMHGSYEANFALQNSDVVLAVGTRFDDRVVGNVKHFNQNSRKIIHIDIDPSSISKRVRVDVPIVGDVKDVLVNIIEQVDYLRSIAAKQASTKKWWDQIKEWRAKNSKKYSNSDNVIKPQFVIEKLWEVTGGNAIVTSDVGQHQMWTAQYYGFRSPRRWINSGGLGTMGVGLPYAMGVQKANPNVDIAVVTGEASIQMNIQEMSTCLQYNLTPKIICLNNRFLGMVRQWQEIDYGSRYSQSYMESLPDFVKLAESYGHIGIRIEKPSDIEPALREAFTKHRDRLVFMDFITDRTENVWPMVKAGRGLTEMLLGPEDL
ncbi:acetolactate synthase I/II/III large subunit [Candidatus Kinetoplastibacterium blastocrithidii TCC012E]|uniref:Acetolactate synthase n=1 Tax=Candidatus Kinetoplastidibacterium blastocrithidiae TCC012E TaxID=1208922 RepID=M1M0Y6_9PROT|nr:biosynthetic-type acetolactate synthase large subunit [Candidatus Kinetoplastibacterium blastocrithidii]AFZ83816.1 acetolactate synthase large subunit [Candidatus Kinetoplastibacterium blastocrithidii (ex Strigomonas culicis)]AGF49941.1 acetolactate synthase I/II/III large subunit [Candidatus Kinetoplastibacterium blastocrithidii TCC012E]